MIDKGKTDLDITKLLEVVELKELQDKWGLDTKKPWHDIFSGGQRQ